MNLIDSFGNPDVIWDRVKRSIVTQSYPDGGLKIMWGFFGGFFFLFFFFFTENGIEKEQNLLVIFYMMMDQL